MNSQIIVGIDASRNRSGGAKVHLRGILTESDPRRHGITHVHLWSYKKLLDALPNFPWLTKHNPPPLERSLPAQIIWQRFHLVHDAKRVGCDIMLNTDAGSVSSFQPMVTMSRDMLSYEPGELRRYGLRKQALRLLVLRYVQNSALRRASGVVFLTRYAARVIQESCGSLERIAYIPHGVSQEFFAVTGSTRWQRDTADPIRCLYVSNAELYKHQWTVIRAVRQLRKRNLNLRLILAGGGSGKAQKMIDAEISRSDTEQCFVKQIGFVPPEKLPALLATAQLFIFASSCENMPNTLVEAMAAGLPIACSERGPMPEILQDGGVYFDPEDESSIADGVAELVCDEDVRTRVAARAKELASKYSWSRCGAETWQFIRDVYSNKGSCRS